MKSTIFQCSPQSLKNFYQPRHRIPLKAEELPQLPATVYWKNYLMPDQNEVLQTGFYTSDSDTDYLVIVQGMNSKGQLGFLQHPMRVRKE